MRSDILERRKDIELWISNNESKSFMCKELKCKPSTLDSYLAKMDIKYAGNKPMRGKPSPARMTAVRYAATKYPKAHVLRLKIIEDGVRPHKCEKCLCTDWNGQPIPLELHHVNGKFNNNFSNLLLLCPNCHAQTDNYSGKGKKK